MYRCSEQVYREAETGAGREPWRAAFCYVLAPALFSYVLWVLEDALKSGKRRLYFLARDGYMMYLTAEYLCSAWKLPLECRYLYCSRMALRSGEYRLLGEESLEYICLGGMKVTLEKMLGRGGLDREEALAAASYMGLGHEMRRPLSYEQIKAMKPRLKANPLFMERMAAHAEEEYSYVIGYLRQEGLLEEVPFALVDSGWTGSMQRSLQRLLESAGCRKKIEGYYFGLYEYAEGMDPGTYHPWYFAPEHGNCRKAFFCNNLFECVFSSPEGMAKGYRWQEGRLGPVFAAEGNPNRKRIQAGLAILLRYAECYVKQVGKADGSMPQIISAGTRQEIGEISAGTRQGFRETSAGEKQKSRGILAGTDKHRDIRPVLSRLLSSLMGRPSKGEAAAFGRYAFDDDVTGEEKRTIAHAFTAAEVQEEKFLRRLRRYVLGKEHPALQSAWPEACLVLSDAAGGTDLVQASFYKFLLYSRKSLVLHFGNNGEFSTCFLRQCCVVISQRCHRIASFFRLALTQKSGTEIHRNFRNAVLEQARRNRRNGE